MGPSSVWICGVIEAQIVYLYLEKKLCSLDEVLGFCYVLWSTSAINISFLLTLYHNEIHKTIYAPTSISILWMVFAHVKQMSSSVCSFIILQMFKL